MLVKSVNSIGHGFDINFELMLRTFSAQKTRFPATYNLFRKLRFNCKGLVLVMKTMSLQVTEHITINVSHADSICVKKSLDSEENYAMKS